MNYLLGTVTRCFWDFPEQLWDKSKIVSEVSGAKDYVNYLIKSIKWVESGLNTKQKASFLQLKIMQQT